MPEVLVLFACLNNTGCQETSTQYFQLHPEVKQIIRATEDRVKQIIGPAITTYVTPIAGIVTGHDAALYLTGNVSLTIHNKTPGVLFKKEF